jgi:hypothetical protein
MDKAYKKYSEHEHGREVAKDRVSDAKMIRGAMRAHDTQLHGGKHTKLPKMASGGRLGMTAGSESGVGRLQKAKKY